MLERRKEFSYVDETVDELTDIMIEDPYQKGTSHDGPHPEDIGDIIEQLMFLRGCTSLQLTIVKQPETGILKFKIDDRV